MAELRWPAHLDQAGLYGYLVHLVSLVDLVYLVGLAQPNRRDRPNRPNEQDRLADFFGILLALIVTIMRATPRFGGLR